MKEQVILEREEYLKLKELADKNQEDINKMKCDVKGSFLKEMFGIIYTGMHDGYHDVLWGVDVDWPKADEEWSKWLRWMKGSIEREDWYDALGCLQKAVREIVKENRLHSQSEDITSKLGAETIERLQKLTQFNELPWYKKILYKI